LTVRKAKIDPNLRQQLEQYGVAIMQILLALGQNFEPAGIQATLDDSNPDLRDDVLAWLTEQHDIQERKETVTFWMEFAIVVLVAAELAFSILNFIGCTLHHSPPANQVLRH
jgi:hypothetical protein